MSSRAIKKERKSLSLEVKLKVLKEMDKSGKATEVGRQFGLSESTVRTIVKSRDKLLRSSEHGTPTSAKKITRTRPAVIEKMEQMLSVWIEDMNKKNAPISQDIVCAKAISLYESLKQQEGEGSSVPSFVASNGWFEKLKKRLNLHNIRVTGEAASADTAAASEFPTQLHNYILREKIPACLVFNADETGLYWKKMPSRTFISKEERQASGFKAAKNRLTLLLGGNATGDLKLKPLLVYQSETPRVMRGMDKDSLPVIWRSNRKAWVTREVFSDWFTNSFCPEVKAYCNRNRLPPKVLLLLDNAPGHPPTFDSPRGLKVEVMFLPPNTTSILQPMDQGAIANFKAYYHRRTFGQLIRETDGEGQQSMSDWWKSFNIFKAVQNIAAAWNEVKLSSMNGVWRSLWPDVVEAPSRRLRVQDTTRQVIEDIAVMMEGSELGSIPMEELEEFVATDSAPLSNEELLAMQNTSQINEEEPSEERKLSSKSIQEALSKIYSGLEILESSDSDVNRVLHLRQSIENGVATYEKILIDRKKNATQKTLDQYFSKN